MANRTTLHQRRRKRAQPPVFSGISGSYEDKDSDFLCPICFNLMEEVHMTKCGHSYCHKCIKESLQQSNRCPKCTYVIEGIDHVFPNFMLNELVLKYRGKQEQKKIKLEQKTSPSTETVDICDMILEDNIDLCDVNKLLEVLNVKKQKLEGDIKFAQKYILKEFLQEIKKRKQGKLEQLKREISLIDDDFEKVDGMLSEHRRKYPYIPDHLVPNGFEPTMTASTDPGSQDGFNGSKNAGKPWLQTTMASRRKRVSQHFEDLEQCYFSIRQKDEYNGEEGLDEFTECLSKFTKFNSFRSLATLSYASDIYSGSSIVSSIEFDRDCDFFAIAGVTKKNQGV